MTDQGQDGSGRDAAEQDAGGQEVGGSRSPADRLVQARRQLAVATSEFQKAIAAVRDPGRRREVTDSYVGLLHKALVTAQQGLDRYEQRRAGQQSSAQQSSGDRPPAGGPSGGPDGPDLSPSSD